MPAAAVSVPYLCQQNGSFVLLRLAVCSQASAVQNTNRTEQVVLEHSPETPNMTYHIIRDRLSCTLQLAGTKPAAGATECLVE